VNLRTVPRPILAAWLILALILAIRTVVSPVRHTVFPLLAASSVRYWNDQPLYGDYKPLDYFRYPPVFAVAVTPLAALGLCLGGILWAFLNLAVFGAGLLRMWRDLLPARDWSERRQLLFFLLALLGALRGLWNGQSNALAVGLLLLGAAELVCQRPWRSAFWLAGAIALKLTPLAAVLLLVAVFPRSLVWRVPAALAAIGLVPFLLGPPGMVSRHYEEWLNHLVSSSSERWPGFRDAWTLYLAGQQQFGLTPDALPLEETLASPGYRLMQLLVAGAALVWCLWNANRGKDCRIVVLETLAMGLGWLMLFGPAVESASFAFLAPVVAWAVVQPGTGPVRRSLAGVSAFLILILGWNAVGGLLRPVFPAVLGALPLGTCLILLWLVTRSRPGLRAAPAIGKSLPASLSLLRGWPSPSHRQRLHQPKE